MDDVTIEFEKLLGQAVLAIWGDLPREAQELLFESAVASDADIRGRLAAYLHQHHPKTEHGQKPFRRPDSA
jgi:hypothetical protein